jgi:hypothetical protein
MTEAEQQDYLEGRGETRISFEEIDQRYTLKMRAFIKVCMPPIFQDLERRARMFKMRQRGIAPIMFHLVFENTPTPLVFNSRLETEHKVSLRRSVTPDAKAPGGETVRLLLEMESRLTGRPGSGDADTLGFERGAGPPVPAGSMRALHVITRPVAAPGERQVTEVPEELRSLRVRPFDGPLPGPEALAQVAAGFAPVAAGPWEEYTSVWGLPNTDINQHVNVHEYICGMENHFSRLLFAARQPVERHRIARTELIFRKPFFPGDLYRIRGRIWLNGGKTLLVGAFHKAAAEGQVDERPSVAVRMEGEVDSPPR